jgi:hypothetical protein
MGDALDTLASVIKIAGIHIQPPLRIFCGLTECFNRNGAWSRLSVCLSYHFL